jgi:hypothetical protein
VSIAAVKGFITAWLFPRIVIVLGSILGLLFLALQTYILWSQTKILSVQSDAAQIERAERLRERIARANAIFNNLRITSNALATVPTWKQHPCDSSCESATLERAIGELQDAEVSRSIEAWRSKWEDDRWSMHRKPRGVRIGDDVKQPSIVHLTLSRHLQRLTQLGQAIRIEQTRSQPHNVGAWAALAGFDLIDIEPAVLHCAIPPNEAKRALAPGRMIHDLARGVAELEHGQTWFWFAIAIARLPFDYKQESKKLTRDKASVYPIATFVTDIDHLQSEIQTGIAFALVRCEAAIARDTAALSVLESQK